LKKAKKKKKKKAKKQGQGEGLTIEDASLKGQENKLKEELNQQKLNLRKNVFDDDSDEK
jgi:hypothetical protein